MARHNKSDMLPTAKWWSEYAAHLGENTIYLSDLQWSLVPCPQRSDARLNGTPYHRNQEASNPTLLVADKVKEATCQVCSPPGSISISDLKAFAARQIGGGMPFMDQDGVEEREGHLHHLGYSKVFKPQSDSYPVEVSKLEAWRNDPRCRFHYYRDRHRQIETGQDAVTTYGIAITGLPNAPKPVLLSVRPNGEWQWGIWDPGNPRDTRGVYHAELINKIAEGDSDPQQIWVFTDEDQADWSTAYFQHTGYNAVGISLVGGASGLKAWLERLAVIVIDHPVVLWGENTAEALDSMGVAEDHFVENQSAVHNYRVIRVEPQDKPTGWGVIDCIKEQLDPIDYALNHCLVTQI